MRPVVSVIVPTKNRQDLLPEALASIARQEVAGVEVIVVNDGGASVESIVDGFRGAFTVRLVELERSMGPAAARNVGLDVAAGDYVAFLDDDDLFLAGHIAPSLALLRAGTADLVASATLICDRRLPADQIDARTATYWGCPNALDVLQVANPLAINSVVCRSPAGTAARFDVSLGFCEDWDMWLRLNREHGYRFTCRTEPTTVYCRIPTLPSATNTANADCEAFRSTLVAYAKVCERWPVPPDGPAAKLRVYMDVLYAIAFKRFAEGRRLPYLFYEDTIAVFSESLAGRITDGELRRRVFAALGEPLER